MFSEKLKSSERQRRGKAKIQCAGTYAATLEVLKVFDDVRFVRFGASSWHKARRKGSGPRVDAGWSAAVGHRE